jgi:hypothetical protein
MHKNCLKALLEVSEILVQSGNLVNAGTDSFRKYFHCQELVEKLA